MLKDLLQSKNDRFATLAVFITAKKEVITAGQWIDEAERRRQSQNPRNLRDFQPKSHVDHGTYGGNPVAIAG